MIDWLRGLRDRLGGGMCRWHHWLPAFGYCTLLLAMTVCLGRGGGERLLAGGLADRGLPARALASLATTLDSATKGAAPSNVRPPSVRPQLSAIGAGRVAQPGQALPPSTAATAVAAVEKQPEVNPLLVGSMASLPLTVPARVPDKIVTFGREDRKKLFISLLLPAVMVALDEVRQERQQLLAIIDELGADPVNLTFSEDQEDWQQRLGADKTNFILTLTRKYRSAKADELVVMVNVLPPSLVIAQGAIESSWGASRFATEVNNLFGMYASVDANRSTGQDGGKATKIMEYDSILESVRAYILNINRLSAYKELRRIRCQTLDPMLIAEGLTSYSERKKHYVADVKHIIARNNLQDYDALIAESV